MRAFLKIKCFILIFGALTVEGQNADSLFLLLESEMDKVTDYTSATFKTTRLINCHTTERLGKGDLDFRINHRFGQINKGIYDFYGLDYATNYLNLEYGITDKITTGIGRTNWQKTYTGLFKFIILRQCKGKKVCPVSLAYVNSFFVKTIKWEYPDRKNYFWSRLDYMNQILIARKFSASFSAQLAPTLVHRNLTENPEITNDIFALALAGRYKISKRIAITAEYIAIAGKRFSPFKNAGNPFSFGFDIETGGHVFQLHFTNATGMTENAFIPFTTGKWKNGDVQFGFNISRVFKW